MQKSSAQRRFYPALALSMSAAAYWGFAYTYFIPNVPAGFNWLATPDWVMPTAFMLPSAGTPVGDAASRIMASFARVFGGLY